MELKLNEYFCDFRPCTKDTLMRIASISKPITASIAAKLVESGKIQLDKSIYVSFFNDFKTYIEFLKCLMVRFFSLKWYVKIDC